MNGQSLMNQGCGGTLVGDTYVITAAHCTDGMRPNNLFVRLGETSLDTSYESYSKTIGVKKIIQHPAYDSSTFANDISILQLKKKISLKDYPNIKPACLPHANALFPGEAIVTGWGTVQSGGHLTSYLNEVGVTVFADGNCGSMNSLMTEDMICAGLLEGGRDSCQGDSGGPLVAADPARNNSMSLIGIVSWGYGCAEADSLGIYSEVSHFIDWLTEQMPDLNTCPPPAEGQNRLMGSTDDAIKVLSLPKKKKTKITEKEKSRGIKTIESATSLTENSSSKNTGSCGNCVFPFIFDFRQSDRCTTINGDQPWCATSVDSWGYMVEWEYCTDPSCPGLEGNSEEMSVHPDNAVGNCCKLKYFKHKHKY